MLRMAPAKKRNTSAMAGISSFSTARYGLPQLSDSSRASRGPFCSILSARASSMAARSRGTFLAQAGKARCAASTASVTCSGDASCMRTMLLPVAGLMMSSSSPSPVMN